MQAIKQAVQRLGAAVGLVLAVAVVGGCGDELGKDTACSKFVNLSTSDQETAIRSLLKDKGQDQSAGNVLIARGSAQAYCRTIGTDKSIEGIYGG